MQKLATRRAVLGFITSIILALSAGCAAKRGGPTPAPAQAAPPPVQLRVLTYNILHGAGLDGKLDLARTAEVIKRVNPDLVALQEVDKGTHRSGRVDEAAELGKLTGMHAVFGKAMDFNGGQYGEAILSRYPFESTTLHALPQIKGREPRGALDVQIKVEGQSLRFISTHWDHLDDDSNRIPQAKFLADVAASATTPMILAGDLNDQPGSAAIAALGPGWADTTPADPRPSWRADAPSVRLDYILARPAKRWRVVSAEVIKEPLASDHRPVLAVLELLPALNQ